MAYMDRDDSTLHIHVKPAHIGEHVAAVSHDKHLEPPGQLANGMPIRLLAVRGQGHAAKGPILLQLADEVPSLVPQPFEEALGRIPLA